METTALKCPFCSKLFAMEDREQFVKHKVTCEKKQKKAKAEEKSRREHESHVAACVDTYMTEIDPRKACGALLSIIYKGEDVGSMIKKIRIDRHSGEVELIFVPIRSRKYQDVSSWDFERNISKAFDVTDGNRVIGINISNLYSGLYSESKPARVRLKTSTKPAYVKNSINLQIENNDAISNAHKEIENRTIQHSLRMSRILGVDVMLEEAREIASTAQKTIASLTALIQQYEKSVEERIKSEVIMPEKENHLEHNF